MRSSRRLLLTCAALLVCCAPHAVRADGPKPLNAAEDSRLAKRISLYSEGTPVSHVVKRLSEKTGVALSVAGAPGDEHLIAVASDTTLAEAMKSIAELYGLRWLRSTLEGKPAYQLIKPLERARQEADLRQRALQTALADLNRKAQVPPRPDPQDPDGHFPRLRAAAIASVTPLWDRLSAEGYLSLPVASLPPDFARVIRSDGPPFAERMQTELLGIERTTRQQLLGTGQPLPSSLKEEPKARDIQDLDHWRVTYQLRTDEGLQLQIMLEPSSFSSTLFLSQGAAPESDGALLYADRQPRPEAGGKLAPALPADDPLNRKLLVTDSLVMPQSGNSANWLTGLENLARVGRVAVYSDDYSNPATGGKQRDAAPLKSGQSAADYLDKLCERQFQAPRAFWWKDGGNVFLRSRGFLFEADSVIPARLVDALLARRALDGKSILLPADLVDLSRLTPAQLQGLSRFAGPLQAWRMAVQFPARLSLASRAAVVSGGLSTQNIPAPDRALAQQLASLYGVDLQNYSARIIAGATNSSWGSFSQIQLRLQTSLTPGSEWDLALPAPQANPRGLLVADPTRLKGSPKTDHLVLAKYYPWYGLREVSGETRKLKISDGRIQNFAHAPTGGPYDSTDEAVLRRHVQQMKQAGVDVICCYCTGPGTFEDGVVRKLLPLARAEGLRLCVELEDFKPMATAVFRAETSRWLKSLAGEEGYFKVDGRPVVFIGFTLYQSHSLQDWNDLFEDLGRASPPGVVAVGALGSFIEMSVFTGGWVSATTGEEVAGFPPDAPRPQPTRADTARLQALGRLAAVRVAPGFDMRHFSPDEFRIDRAGGAYYKKLWADAAGAAADWILVDSFNQWEVGTEIEPSREYGEAYLNATTELAQQFKNAARK